MALKIRGRKIRMPWWFSLSWRNKRILPILFLIEFPFTVAGLAIFGISDPNTYRTNLWQEGANKGWSSAPSSLLYAAANYRPANVPTPWAQLTTDWNVVVSVLSLFIYLVKCVMYISHLWPPALSAFVHSAVLAVWVTSIAFQAGSDYVDPKHPSKFPWYLQHTCTEVSAGNQVGCKMTQAGFAVTVLMSALYLAYIIASIRFAIPTAHQREAAIIAREEEDDLESPTIAYYSEDKLKEFEMSPVPKTPTFAEVPFTPRTQAFNALEGRRPAKAKKSAKIAIRSEMAPVQQTVGSPNRDLPLRHHISMQDGDYQGGSARFA